MGSARPPRQLITVPVQQPPGPICYSRSLAGCSYYSQDQDNILRTSSEIMHSNLCNERDFDSSGGSPGGVVHMPQPVSALQLVRLTRPQCSGAYSEPGWTTRTALPDTAFFSDSVADQPRLPTGHGWRIGLVAAKPGAVRGAAWRGAAWCCEIAARAWRSVARRGVASMVPCSKNKPSGCMGYGGLSRRLLRAGQGRRGGCSNRTDFNCA